MYIKKEKELKTDHTNSLFCWGWGERNGEIENSGKRMLFLPFLFLIVTSCSGYTENFGKFVCHVRCCIYHKAFIPFSSIFDSMATECHSPV